MVWVKLEMIIHSIIPRIFHMPSSSLKSASLLIRSYIDFGINLSIISYNYLSSVYKLSKLSSRFLISSIFTVYIFFNSVLISYSFY